MKPGWAAVFGIAGGLLAAGLILLIGRPPHGESILLRPPPTPEPIIVHVSGAVTAPGVYTLPQKSRVRDAIAAAGGASQEADLNGMNLAAPLVDGQQVRLLFASDLPTSPNPNSEQPVRSQPLDGLLPAGLLDINQASAEQLEALPGIGPVTAANMIAYRQENGPFASLEDLLEVPGIGDATLDKIRDLITAGAGP